MIGHALVGYFGYGSLVNRKTLSTDFVDVVPASLKGWRRHWQSRGLDAHPETGEHIALLSVHREKSAAIQGVVVIDRRSNLGAVDLREARYRRQRLDVSQIDITMASPTRSLPDEIYIYVGTPVPDNGGRPKLLQSYLDTVLAGFHDLYGESGVARFMQSTIGFDRSILADREAPVYPRAVRPAQELCRRFDELLRGSGVIFPQ